MNSQGQQRKTFSGIVEGMRLAWFTGRTLFSLVKHNENMRVLNALLNPSVRRTNRDAVSITDTQWILEINGSAGAGAAAPAIGNLQRMSVIQTYGDYIQCLNSLNNAVNVAKPPLLRFSVTSRPVFGVTATYDSFSAVPTIQNTDQSREVSSPSFGGKILELVYPGYYTGDVICAQSMDHTGVFVSGAELQLIDTNVDKREWMMAYGQ